MTISTEDASFRAAIVRHDATVEEAIAHMNNEAALVVDDDGRLCGLVTDGDLRRAFLAGARPESPVAEIMTRRPTTVRRGTPPQQILLQMLRLQVRHIPIVDDDNRPVGLELFKDQINDVSGAVVMAGGLGTRLRPLTLNRPKPLLPIGDSTILDTVLSGLGQSGVRDVVISVNYLADQIIDHAGNGDAHQVNISYVTEKKRLGTAGALTLLDPRPGGSFIVMNADLITDLDMRAFARYHHENHHDFTVCVRRYTMPIPYGVVDLDPESQDITDIVEKPDHEFFVNAGIYILKPALIDLVPDGAFFDMTSLIRAGIEAGYRVGAFPIVEYWRDIGRPQEMAKAEAEWRARPAVRNAIRRPSVPVDLLACEAVS